MRDEGAQCLSDESQMSLKCRGAGGVAEVQEVRLRCDAIHSNRLEDMVKVQPRRYQMDLTVMHIIYPPPPYGIVALRRV